MQRSQVLLSLALIATFLSQPICGAETRDGRLFDPGATMKVPAESAPKALAKLQSFIGDWKLNQEVHRPGQEVLKSEGIARVTFMNRGHAILERTRISDFDGQGHSMSTATFLAVNGQDVWTASEVNSWTESISVTNGGFEGDRLILHDAIRPGGGPNLLLLRRSYQPTQDGFETKIEVSRDFGKVWQLTLFRNFRRQASINGFFPARNDLGQPAPGRAPEADQFDFLLGEFDATHWLKQGETERRWTSNASAVFALDGHAFLEFSWHNNDPTLPDAATSILRIYNRSMRRWESLYLNNRGNTPLHFGGVREGDKIILHPFSAQTGANPLFQWIFFSVTKDTYRWKGLQSTDRGAAYNPTWTIEFARKGKSKADG